MSYSSVFRSVATVTVLSVITRTLAFLFKIYLSRAVGAEILGLYQICLSVFFLFISLTSGGLTTVLSRKIAESDALGDKTGSLTYLTASLAIGMTAAAVSVGALYLFAPYATVLISDERALPLLRIMLPALLSTTFYIIIRGWFWGTKQFGAFSVTELIEEVLRILCTLLLVSGVVSGINGATGIALAFTVSDVTVAIIVFVMFLRKGGKFRKFGSVGEMLKPSAPLTVMRVFGSLVGTALALILPARLIAGGMSVSEATASVGRIAGMANPLLFAPNAIIGSLAIVLIPEMSADNVRGNYASLNRRIDTGISLALIVSGAFLAIYLALGEEITLFLYDDSQSGLYLAACAPLLLLMPVNQIVTSTLNSVGMEKESFYTFTIGTIFMIAACYILPKYIGIYAVIVANAACLVIEVIGNVYLLNKKIKLKLGFLKTFLLIAVFAFPCKLIIDWVYNSAARVDAVFAIGAAAVAGSAMYFALCYVAGLIDLDLFMSRVRKRGGARSRGAVIGEKNASEKSLSQS